ncbi:MAG: hypothetical protein L6Q97_07745 [Thermoanaerobaculia bacterium]|nr:hypothetical protein [Thermoanaerobaculia bacterium]
MKKAVRIFGVLFIAALFGVLTGVAERYSPEAAPPVKAGSAKEIYSASVSTHPFSQHPSSEHSVKSFSNTPSSFKNPFSGFWAVLKLAGQLFESRYAQYVAGSKSFLIRFRKADIVFPFHYFW